MRVTYQTVDELFSEFARNINEGGIFIETDNPAAPRVVGLAAVQASRQRRADRSGRDRRSDLGRERAEDPSGMGIEFGDLSASARQQINEIVRQLRATAERVTSGDAPNGASPLDR